MTTKPLTDRAVQRKTTQRIVGLDIARAFAIIGMVIVNFKVVMSAENAGSPWLQLSAATLDGRAAATFVILAGIGASLGSRRARESDDPAQKRRAQITLFRRAVFLFVVGWLFFPIWPADILHYYGIFLAIGAAVLFAPGRRLIWLAVGAAILSLLFILFFDYFANWNLDDLSYEGITTPSGIFRNLFFDGFHPVVPWVAFYLFGMWLGRTNLRNSQWRRKIAIRSAIAVLATETAAWFVLGPKGSDLSDIADESWRWLFSVEPIPPLPLYLVAGVGTACLVIVGSIWLGEHLRPALAEPLVSTGQLALTIYLAHVFIGMGLLEATGHLEDQTLRFAVLTSLLFCAGAILFSWAWRRRFSRGPVEWLMRRIAG